MRAYQTRACRVIHIESPNVYRIPRPMSDQLSVTSSLLIV